MAEKKEINEHPNISFKLNRGASIFDHRMLVCSHCKMDDRLCISLSDNGQWVVTCAYCNDSQALLGEIISNLN